METIPLPWLGFLRGVFLANHLASNDNLIRTTEKQNTYQQKLTKTNIKRALINNNTITRSSADVDKLSDAFRGQSRSPNMVPFHMLGMVSY